MAGYASINISGNVTSEPRYQDVNTENGKRTVMRFSVAADHGWGERKKSTFFECEHWMPQSEKAVNYLGHAMGKGAKVHVTGEPYIDRWTDRDGNERTSIKVAVTNLNILVAAPTDVPQDDRPQRPAPKPQNDPYDENIPF